MHTHYLEYRVLDRQEAAHIIGLAVHALHGYLSRHELDTVGIALPEARFQPPEPEQGEKAKPRYRQHPHPGDKLRVFAPDEAVLRGLLEWEGLALLEQIGAVEVKGIKAVPAEPEGHSLWRRTRLPERETGIYALRNLEKYVRHLQNKGISGEEASQRLENRRERLSQRMKNPPPALFLRSHSKSTRCQISLFIERQDLEEPIAGTFNRYGLSSIATVPRF